MVENAKCHCLALLNAIEHKSELDPAETEDVFAVLRCTVSSHCKRRHAVSERCRQVLSREDWL